MYKASGLSATQVRKRYGFGQMNERSKATLCVRVDGASDESPSHEEVQFFWMRDHLLNQGRRKVL